jgi:hypothetical protein
MVSRLYPYTQDSQDMLDSTYSDPDFMISVGYNPDLIIFLTIKI